MQARFFLTLSVAALIAVSVSALPPAEGDQATPAATLESTAAATSDNAPISLRSLAAARQDKPGFLMGAAVAYPQLLSEPQYGNTLAREYNLIVPENVMKWDTTQPTKTFFNFTPGDDLVAFAEAHGMKVRGHTLVWHNQLPSWVTGGTFTHDELLAILKNHIQTVVTHFKSHVFAWDVVNEAFNDDGSLRDTLWSKTIGPDFIEQAFRFAHDADPDAKLFINDYSAEGINPKSDAIYALVKSFKASGVPIDGVGLQMHIGIAANEKPTTASIDANIARLGALGLQVHITEMDVKIQNGTGTDADKLAAQAKVYADVLGVCLKESACTAFLTWGFTDKYSWIPGFTHHADAPLPFDTTYQPKPAYNAMIQTLSGN